MTYVTQKKFVMSKKGSSVPTASYRKELKKHRIEACADEWTSPGCEKDKQPVEVGIPAGCLEDSLWWALGVFTRGGVPAP